jgi:Na+/H+ antiporter NhaC
MDVGAWSLLPATVSLVLAFATRQVLVSLLAGVLTGGVVRYFGTGDPWALDPVSTWLMPTLGSAGYAKVLLIYLWCLGGLLGIWERTGAAGHFARTTGTWIVRGPRSALLYTWLLGLVFHQGGTVSTVLTGSTAKPLCDAHRVSHEELSYVVDSTASPVATLIPFNAWPAYVAGLCVGVLPDVIPDASAGLSLFFRSIPYNFYGMFAVAGTLLFALGLWGGPSLGAARRRARETGQLDRPGARPILPPKVEDRTAPGYVPHLVDFVAPLAVLIALGVGPWLIVGRDFIPQAFAACLATAAVIAAVRGLGLGGVTDAFLEGCRDMTFGAVVLGLALAIGNVTKELGTAAYVASVLPESFPALALPPLLLALCMAIAFATGTSWGTYAVVVPVAVALAWRIHPDPTYLSVCFGAVLGGAVFGDQCSPISDTTLLSAMFSGCDLMDHVSTQLPPALVAAALSGLASTVAAWTTL